MATPVSGITWPSKTITWAFAEPGEVPHLGTVTAAVTDAEERTAVTAGVNEWREVSGVRLMQIGHPASADVVIGYGKPPQLLGECLWFYNPQTATYWKALVLFRKPETSFDKNSAGQLTYPGLEATLQQLAAHEFGAALGLAEGSGDDKTSVMNHLQNAANPAPDAADIAAIDQLFGLPAEGSKSSAIGSQDSLVLVLSEDAWHGDAAFTVAVNGERLGSPTMVTASNRAGAMQRFTYHGNWGTGPVKVEIAFVNDAYGGAPDKDRNLYIQQVIYNGISELTKPQPLLTTSSISVTVGG